MTMEETKISYNNVNVKWNLVLLQLEVCFYREKIDDAFFGPEEEWL